LYGGVLGRQGYWQRSAQVFEELCQLDPHAELRFLYLSNLAYAATCRHLLSQDWQNLAQADRLSQEAYALAPWHPIVQGARGALLVETGKVDEGMVLLRQAFEQHLDDQDQAEALAFLAIGEARREHPLEAHCYLDAAAMLAPDHLLVEHARRLVH